jgi:hypothetical protein
MRYIAAAMDNMNKNIIVSRAKFREARVSPFKLIIAESLGQNSEPRASDQRKIAHWLFGSRVFGFFGFFGF